MGASASGCKISHKWQLSYLAPLPWQFASGPRSTPPPRPRSKSICRRTCSERSPMADRSSITLPLSLCATPKLPGLATTTRAGGQRSHPAEVAPACFASLPRLPSLSASLFSLSENADLPQALPPPPPCCRLAQTLRRLLLSKVEPRPGRKMHMCSFDASKGCSL